MRLNIEHKEPVIVEFFILRLTMLEFYHNFLTNCCDDDLKLDTGAVYSGLAEIVLCSCIRIGRKRARLGSKLKVC